MLIWYLFWYYTISLSAKIHIAPVTWQLHHTYNKMVLLIRKMIWQWSQEDLGIIWKGSQFTILWYGLRFFSQVDLILLSCHIFFCVITHLWASFTTWTERNFSPKTLSWLGFAISSGVGGQLSPSAYWSTWIGLKSRDPVPSHLFYIGCSGGWVLLFKF